MFNTNIQYSDEHIEGADICTNYSDGKCSAKSNKYCDGCASDFD